MDKDSNNYINKILKTEKGEVLGLIKKVQHRFGTSPIATVEYEGAKFFIPIPKDQVKQDSDGAVTVTADYIGTLDWGLPTGIDERQIWKELDTKFKETLRSAQRAFSINTNINIILVIIGVVLISNSLIYTWARGSDGFSLLTGGAGIATVVSLFFYRSQNNIDKALKSLASVDMAYKSHYLALESISDYHTLHNSTRREIGDLKAMNELLNSVTVSYIESIENKCTDSQDRTVPTEKKTLNFQHIIQIDDIHFTNCIHAINIKQKYE